MNKFLKILIISLINIFFIFAISCYAVNIDMNLSSNLVDMDSDAIATDFNNISTQSNSYSNSSNMSSNVIDDGDDYQASGNSSTVGGSSTNTSNRNTSIADTLHSLPESELGLTNVLNILLIAVGFVLILLAIAIFLRLKK